MKINLKKVMEIKNAGKEKLILLVVAGILLIGASYFESERNTGQTKETETVISNQEADYRKEAELKVTEMIKSIKGVSDVSVMITLKSGSEKVLKEDSENSNSYNNQENSSENSSSQKKSTVILENGDGENPYIIKEIYPKVEGIAVMGKGISNSSKKEEIINMLSALFDIPVHKISVIEIN